MSATRRIARMGRLFRAWPASRWALLFTAFLLTGGVVTAVQAAPAKPGLTLQITPASQSVQRGQVASYTVSVSPTGGFTGPVSLSASGLPANSTASFQPASATLTSSGTATSTLTLTTTASTPVGSYTVTVTGTSGKVSGSVTAGLTVNYPVSSSFSLTAAPASVTVAAGSTAVYTLTITRTNFTAPVTLAVYGGLPSGATATFNPNPATGTSSTLQIAAPATTADGSYALYLVGSGANAGGGTSYAYAQVGLTITTVSTPFTISGNAVGKLYPGQSQPLNLTLTNPNKKALSVTNLSLVISGVTQAAGATRPCGAGDYTVIQYSGPYPLTIPGSGSATLSSLGVPQAAWPRVGMLDTSSNQDGCKNATVNLAYAGSGQGS